MQWNEMECRESPPKPASAAEMMGKRAASLAVQVPDNEP